MYNTEIKEKVNMRNFISKVKYFILGGLLLGGIGVLASQISVPSAPGQGYLLQSTTTGNYVPTSLNAGTNITISSTTNSITINATGGGSGGGTFSTTTSNVAGQLINHPNNNTDIVVIGASATTTGKTFFDPNFPANFLLGSTTISGNATTTGGLAVGSLFSIATSGPFARLSVGNTAGIIPFAIGSSTGTSLIVDNYGNLGINTAKPNQGGYGGRGLSIFGDSSNSPFFEMIRPISSGASQVGATTYGDTSNSTLARFGAVSGTTGSKGALFFSTSNGSNLLEAMRIDENQFLGLGTTTPNNKLDINGNIYTSGTAFFGGAITATSSLTLTAQGTGCATFTSGVLSSTGVACGSGGGSSVGTISTSSTPTIGQIPFWNTSGAYPELLGSVATSSETCTSASGISCTAFNVIGTGGALSLSAIPNGSLSNSTISGVALGGTLAALTATNASLTLSGSYDGTTARTVGLNLGNTNTWTILQNFNYSSSTIYSSFLNASTTNLIVNGSSFNNLLGNNLAISSNALGTVNNPTFSTSVTSPINYGGSAVSSSLTLQSTSGAGTSDFIAFQTGNAAEYGRITSIGKFGIGTTTPFAQLQIATTSANQGFVPQLVLTDMTGGLNAKHYYLDSQAGIFDLGTTSDSGTYATSSAFSISGPTTASPGTTAGFGTTSPWRTLSVVGSAAITGLTNSNTGDYVCINTVTFELELNTATCSLSDRRAKTDIQPIGDSLAGILSTPVISFRYKHDLKRGDDIHTGLIAQDVQKVFPEAVTTDKNSGELGLDYNQLTARLWKATQELASQKGGVVKRSVEENWQDILIGLLILGFIYQQLQIKKLKK